MLPETDVAVAVQAGTIVISPFDPTSVAGRGYMLHLAPLLFKQRPGDIIDARKPDPGQFDQIQIDPSAGFILSPGSFVGCSFIEKITIPKNDTHITIEIVPELARSGLLLVTEPEAEDPGSHSAQLFNLGVRAIRLSSGLPIARLLAH